MVIGMLGKCDKQYFNLIRSLVISMLGKCDKQHFNIIRHSNNNI